MSKRKAEISNGSYWLYLVKENWAWMAPFAYVYVTIAGMVQAWLHFHAFGINVFEFSEINDFLLAAFREPLSFLAILGLIAYFGIARLLGQAYVKILRRVFTWLGISVEMKGAWGKFQSCLVRFRDWTFNVTFIVIVIGAPYYVPHFLNDGYGEAWKENYLSNPNRKVSVVFKMPDKYSINAELGDALVLIGTTEEYLFFHDQQHKQIITAPISSVLLFRREELSN